MPYLPPKIWHHGDFPTAADFNAIKDSLDAIHVQTGDVQINPAVAQRISPVQGYYFIHRCPYLIYLILPPQDSGTIEDPAGIGEPVTLAVEASYTFHDLSTVEWFYPGKLYQVQGVTWCIEDVTSL